MTQEERILDHLKFFEPVIHGHCGVSDLLKNELKGLFELIKDELQKKEQLKGAFNELLGEYVYMRDEVRRAERLDIPLSEEQVNKIYEKWNKKAGI